ncbi:MAG: SPOR domain-containing protein [Bacteroidetes bacterium]|nr:SPOR domain-containing protein [Bacteroidota bacterium]
MKKITSLLFLALFGGLSLNAQDRVNKFSANVEIGLGIPFVELNQNSYTGYKPNLGINAGIGYQFDKASRLRGDIMAGQFNGNNTQFYFQSQSYEGSISYEYNLLHLFGPVSNNFKLNGRVGIGAGMMNSYLYDINTRQRLAEVPDPRDGSSFSVQTFVLAGLNAGIPLNKKMDLNLGYAHRILWFQPWVDAFNSESFDTYGYVTVGLTYFLQSDKDPTKMEVDPKKYNALKMKADSSDAFASKLSRTTEKVARLEMSNQEKDMQMEILKTEMDSLKANPVVVSKEVRPGKGENLVIRGEQTNTSGDNAGSEGASAGDTDLGPARYRVIVVSSPTRAGAQRFIDRTRLNTDEMMIAYIERLDTYRVIYKSTDSIEAARKARGEARKFYSDAWITKF